MQPIGCRERGIKSWQIDVNSSLETAVVNQEKDMLSGGVVVIAEN